MNIPNKISPTPIFKSLVRKNSKELSASDQSHNFGYLNIKAIKGRPIATPKTGKVNLPFKDKTNKMNVKNSKPIKAMELNTLLPGTALMFVSLFKAVSFYSLFL